MWRKRMLLLLVGLCALLAAWPAYGAGGQANQQIVHWSMDDLGEYVVNDNNGGNEGIIKGGAALSTNSRFGTGSVSLDGFNGYIRVENSPNLNPTKAITITAWVNVNTWDNRNSRVVQKGNGDNQYRLTSEWKKMRFDLRDVGKLDVELPETGKWVHIAATYDGLQMCIYYDGELVGSKTACGLIATTGDPLYIGAKDGSLPMDCLKGNIDDVAVWGWALNASQIAQIYNSGVSAFIDSQPSAPGEAAIVSRTATAITNIAKNDKAGAQAAVEGLLSTHSSDGHIAPCAIAVANAYMRQREHDKAQALFQEALLMNPQPDQAIEAYKGLSITSIELGQIEEAADYAAIIRDEFSKHEDSSSALYQIANEYYSKEESEKAIGLYGNVVDKWPESEQAIWSCMKMVQHHLRNNDKGAANIVLDKFLALPTGHMLYPAGIRELVYAYERTGYIGDASTLNKYNVEYFPDSIFALWSQGAMTHYYIRNRKFEQAQEAYQTLINVFSKQPTLSKEIIQVADEYVKVAQYDKADVIYQYILDNYRNSDEAIWSCVKMIDYHLNNKNKIAADIAFDKLLALPAEHALLPMGIREAAYKYENIGYNEMACSINKYNVEHFPDDIHAMWSQGAMTHYYIRSQLFEQAQKAYETLITVFSEQPTINTEMTQVADEYVNVGQYDTATQIYHSVKEKWPGSKEELLSQAGLARIAVLQDDTGTSASILNTMMTEWKDHEALPLAIFIVADQYYESGILLKKAGDNEAAEYKVRSAISIWAKIINEIPASDQYLARAWYFTGVAHRRELREPENALVYCKKVIETWPDCEYAWSAQAMIGYCHEMFVRSGQMTEQQATPNIEQAYKAVVEKYPDCLLIPRIYMKLGVLNLKKSKWNEAATYLQHLVERYPKNRLWESAVIYLGIAYEKRGHPDITADLYKALLGITDPDDLRILRARVMFEEQKEVQK